MHGFKAEVFFAPLQDLHRGGRGSRRARMRRDRDESTMVELITTSKGLREMFSLPFATLWLADGGGRRDSEGTWVSLFVRARCFCFCIWFFRISFRSQPSVSTLYSE